MHAAWFYSIGQSKYEHDNSLRIALAGSVFGAVGDEGAPDAITKIRGRSICGVSYPSENSIHIRRSISAPHCTTELQSIAPAAIAPSDYAFEAMARWG
jgi:hypothetical protein